MPKVRGLRRKNFGQKMACEWFYAGLGFTKEQIVPHGFRAMFSTIANENRWDKDVIERQLAHVERNAVRGTYNRVEYMPERIKIMQWWADYLDGI